MEDFSLIWILVPLVALIGGFFLEYQKNKMKMMELGHRNEEEVDELRKYIDKLKTRIENLETIAAGEPKAFKTGAGEGLKELEIEEPTAQEENREQISKTAAKAKTTKTES